MPEIKLDGRYWTVLADLWHSPNQKMLILKRENVTIKYILTT